jgi:hypothetical protein
MIGSRNSPFSRDSNEMASGDCGAVHSALQVTQGRR